MIKFVLLALVVLLGHLGWWIFCYNRINATALPRRFIKRCELLIIALIFIIPLVITISHWHVLSAVARGQAVASAGPVLTLWAVWSIGTVLVLGPLWLESRFWLLPPKNIIAQHTERVNVEQLLDRPLTGTWLSRALRHLPLNEITKLSVTRKSLVVERSFPCRWQALTIGHMSDLHFTGQLLPDYYHYVIERMQGLSPDILVVTGDIIDKDHCLEWIEPILGRLAAPLGCFYLFGNHERRLSRASDAAERLDTLGWHDLGSRDAVVEPSAAVVAMPGRPRIILCGNEQPWFERHSADHWQSGPLAAPDADIALKIGLAHTPDQHPWARELGLDLMLAGHTHGGQVRIPGIGPLVAPSWYGSRFASGVFSLPPTLLHVSRGLAGTQPLRWRCMPEISLLTICPADSGSAEDENTDRLESLEAVSQDQREPRPRVRRLDYEHEKP